MEKLGEELLKEQYIDLFMSKLRQKLLTSFRMTNFSEREEQILSFEKESCELFHFSFVKKNGRGPDEEILNEEIAKAISSRIVRAFGKSKQKTNEEQFVLVHLDRVKSQACMQIESMLPDTYDLALATEKNEALKYFRLHDEYIGGYEHLAISRSEEMISKGLSELMEQFHKREKLLYLKYRRSDIT